MTKKGYPMLQGQIDDAYATLARIDRDIEPGSGAWREQRRYIDGLEFAMEQLNLDERDTLAFEEIADRLSRLDDTLKVIARSIESGVVFS